MTDAAKADADKLSAGFRWNLISFGVIGIAGVGINVLIARFYPPDALGVFNQVLAFFILGGQIGAFAVQSSILHAVPVALARGEPAGQVLTAGVLVTLLLGGVVAIAVWLLRDAIALALGSREIADGLAVAAIGIGLFPVNKVLLAYLNGVRRVRLYAAGNALRFLMIVAALGALAAMDAPTSLLAGSLSVAELAVLAFAGGACMNHFGVGSLTAIRRQMLAHLNFGARGVFGTVLWELNTRIDVLVLGVMASDRQVGLYSMASIFAEGFFQLIMALRFNYDPVLAKLIAQGRRDDLALLIKKGKRLAYAGGAAAGLASILLYPYVLSFLLQKSDYAESAGVYALLGGGIILSAGFIPFSGILQQGGHPGAQSLLIALMVLTSLIGNVLLVPRFGAMGAAAATAIAQVMFVVYLLALARSRLSLKL